MQAIYLFEDTTTSLNLHVIERWTVWLNLLYWYTVNVELYGNQAATKSWNYLNLKFVHFTMFCMLASNIRLEYLKQFSYWGSTINTVHVVILKIYFWHLCCLSSTYCCLLCMVILQDVCQLTNAEQPYWLNGVMEMTRTFGLELLESILRGYPNIFLNVRQLLYTSTMDMLQCLTR